MNALLLTNLFPSSSDPARGLFNLRGFKALSQFCDVSIVVPVSAWRRARRAESLTRVSAETHQGLSATYPTFWTVPRLAMGLHAQAMYRSVRSHVRELHEQRRFDVVLGAFGYPDVVAAAQVARELELPFVAFVLGSDMNVLAQKPSLRGQIRDALVQANHVVAVSAGLKDRVLELGVSGNRVIVQHNGVDGDCFRIRSRQEARAALHVSASDPLVCFVGNLVHEKGPDLLVEALGYLKSKIPGISAVFVGTGTMRDALAARSATLGLADRVRFAGRLPPDEVALWMSAADVLCLPSRREGCPNVVLEALASGRPVVAAAVGGVPELITDANGVMVDPENAQALADGLVRAITREWNPEQLRASVPSLSWQDLGSALYGALSCAVKSSTNGNGHDNRS